MKSKNISASLVAAALCVSACGWTVEAQTASTDQPQIQQPANTQTQQATRVSHLIGTCVKNQQGQRLGKITDVVVNYGDERVSYCVLSVKHGMFGGTRYLAVPLAAFQPSTDGSYVILNANKANLAKARGFDRTQWPAGTIPEWGAEPNPTVELPPVVVTAPAGDEAAPQTPQLWVAAPNVAAPYRQTASQAIDTLSFEVNNGFPLPYH